MGTVKRTEAEWREAIAVQGRSGISQRAWCEASGVNYHTFTKRVLQIHKKDAGVSKAAAPHKAKKGKAGWVEIKVPAGTAVSACGLRVEVGAFRVVVPDNFEEAPFKRVCKALAEIC